MDVKSGKSNLFIQAQQAISSEDKITEAKKTTAPLAPIVAVIAERKAPVRSGATAKTDDDHINTVGHHNTILAEAGNDRITVQGDRNTIEAGIGEDRVKTTGDENVTSGLDSLTEKVLSESS